jgi:hypothetical protein
MSIWPHVPDDLQLPASSMPTALPAPNPLNFGYPADAPMNLPPHAAFDLVPETNGIGFDIRRAIPPLAASEDRPTGSIPPGPTHGPAGGPFADMPRGAFP